MIQFIFTTSTVKVSLNPLKEFLLQLVFILWLEIHVHLIVPILKPLKALLLKGLGSNLVFSMTESFSLPCIKNGISITTG